MKRKQQGESGAPRSTVKSKPILLRMGLHGNAQSALKPLPVLSNQGAHLQGPAGLISHVLLLSRGQAAVNKHSGGKRRTPDGQAVPPWLVEQGMPYR